MKTARIHEIFTSIQGEGIFSGKRQIFVRFFGCNLTCAFCDTYQAPQDIKEYSSEGLLLAVCAQASPENVHSVSLTGGEPLLQIDFLKEFLPKLKQAGYRVYLETNASLPENLNHVIDYVDIVSMDIKLPSSTAQAALWQQHERFLETSMKKQVFVKIIVSDKTTLADFNRATRLIAERDPHIALVIQPVSPRQGAGPVSAAALEQFKNMASEHICKVKIIPQMHRLYGIK